MDIHDMRPVECDICHKEAGLASPNIVNLCTVIHHNCEPKCLGDDITDETAMTMGMQMFLTLPEEMKVQFVRACDKNLQESGVKWMEGRSRPN